MQLLIIGCGFSWALLNASSYQNQRLPEALAGQDILIKGYVSGIPEEHKQIQRFDFMVTSFGDKNSDYPEKIRLSWYYGEKVNAGEHWRFKVRLKPPHGFMNPGGFDFEAWLYHQGIHASGYIRKGDENQRLIANNGFSVDSIRQHISTKIKSILPDSKFAGLITALAVGDREEISSAQWDTLIKTGTNHLMAISGLHIGLAALFGYWFFRRVVPTELFKYITSQQIAISAGLIVAFIYALLAGFTISTQRALIMLAFLSLAFLLKREISPFSSLSAALLLVLILDPAAVHSAGFWFSFIAVYAILYVYQGSHKKNKKIVKWGSLQLVIAIALFPLSLLLFQQTSIIAPVANLFLVPYVSLLVVPLVLLGTFFISISSVVAEFCFVVANSLLEFIWPALEMLAELPIAKWSHAVPSELSVFFAMLGVMLLLAPRGVPAKWLAAIFILPVLFDAPTQPAAGAIEFTLLDVGQGLSVVITTKNHTLVYDTGARFSQDFDAGKAVLVPYLRHRGIHTVDKLIISHGDSDHIGGVESLLKEIEVHQVIGQGIENLVASSKEYCVAGQSWNWDGVFFEIIHPAAVYKRTNNSSCVLKISNQSGAVLLTGDIEKKVEQLLVRKYGDFLKSTVLVAPHHGSKTSSSAAFIKSVQPEIVLFAAGYRNRYKFPKNEIVQRYLGNSATLYTTGLSGAISFNIDAETGIGDIEEYRTLNGKYWNHKLN